MLAAAKMTIQRSMRALGFDATAVRQALEQAKMRAFQLVDGREPEKLMVNIGGTQFFKRDWRVLDYVHPESRHYDFFYGFGPDYNFDLISGQPLPFADGSVAFFYSANTFEHLTVEIMPFLYKELYRCLKPGGAVRIQVPDLRPAMDAFLADDRDRLANLGGDGGRFAAMKYLYGETVARKALPAWPEREPLRQGPFSQQDAVDSLMHVFAGYYKGRVQWGEVMEKAQTLTLEDFGDYYTQDIPMEFRRKHPEEHAMWHTPERLLAYLKQGGFEVAYQTPAFESRFAEMRGVGKYWGFDLRNVNGSCYVEAVKPA